MHIYPTPLFTISIMRQVAPLCSRSKWRSRYRGCVYCRRPWMSGVASILQAVHGLICCLGCPAARSSFSCSPSLSPYFFSRKNKKSPDSRKLAGGVKQSQNLSIARKIYFFVKYLTFSLIAMNPIQSLVQSTILKLSTQIPRPQESIRQRRETLNVGDLEMFFHIFYLFHTP